ncbi:hypothetical protein [Butyrivibrio sp. LC3010]|uniref:hypothetical protein n=1 Tax=Butyrivibrio sp. LC3010 TaxID=1280680 RepID=UPI000407B1B4|nr:hypothetical protein [Butyrivibrio sp. LC3010]
MIRVTAGDALHLYGNVGRGSYSVRLCIRMDENIDGKLLANALKNTEKRYPYLCVRLMKNDTEYYYEENDNPVCLFNTSEQITLNAAETNYHVWAVCYKNDYIYLDFFHGICDGTGMYYVLSTLLYYYLSERYGHISHEGIRTLDDPIEEGEYLDPVDTLPEVDLSQMPQSLNRRNPAFSIVKDGKMTIIDKPVVRDVIIPEKELLKFTSANDASPGTFIAVLVARAIDKLNPEREKDIIGSYIINGRPMLGKSCTHHNCVNTTILKYSDKLKKMPLDRQCTAYRGMTFLQSDAENVQKIMTFSSSRSKMIMKMPDLKGKREAFSQMIDGGRLFFTYMVSYVGQWKYVDIAAHIREFWTHVPVANGFLTEIAAVNGNIFLSIHQNFGEDIYYKSLLKELEDNGIPYTERAVIINDIAGFAEP